MKIQRIPFIFGIVGLAIGGLAAGSLYFFFGPDEKNLGLAGINGFIHLTIFPITSMCIASIMARLWFTTTNRPLTQRSGFTRGAIIGLLTFLGCVITHTFVMLFKLDTNTVLWLTLAALLFGGLAFALPAMLVAGITGALCVHPTRVT